jgi:glyoxylase-like metal-dependent hydrolase (beta-lactamase superfamily II)
VIIHHLNCGTCCPVGGALFDGRSTGPLARLVCHCLLLETDAGLVLVDTGYGRQEAARHSRIPLFFRALNNPQLRRSETARSQVEALGFSADDVRHIIVTHLDFDHAGGLEDFPRARVHVTAREKEAADAQRGGVFVGARRYRPRQWDDVGDWSLYPLGGGERWQGFSTVRALAGLPPEILLVPLTGHTWGHSGVAIDTGQGWLLHAGDAYFHQAELAPDYRCPPGLRFYQRMMEVDRTARLANQRLLRALAARSDPAMRIVCAHDAAEFDACAAGTR